VNFDFSDDQLAIRDGAQLGEQGHRTPAGRTCLRSSLKNDTEETAMRQEPIASQAALPDAYRSPASESTLSRTQVRMFAIAMMGGALEYYEFIVFAFMVPTLSQVFFSNASEPWLSTLQTLAVFAVGYLVRPIGGIFLSALGDRLGRKRTFVISLILMATPTMLIGLLPTYAQIGILAPLLLLACRICQGLAMGAEIPSALTFVVEHAPERRTGFAIGLMGSGLTIGLLLGISAVGALSLGFSQVEVAEYAWRIPFILGGLLGLLSAVLRKYAHETPVFAQMAARKSLNKAMPIREVLSKARPELLIALLASFISNSIVQTAVLFPSTFLQSELHLPAAVVHNAQVGLIAVSVFSVTLGGWLMDRIGWMKSISFAAVGLIAALINLYAVPTQENIYFNMALLGIPCAITIMLNNHLVRVFPAEIRITGIAASHNIATAVAGGVLPILMGYLTHIQPKTIILVPAALALMAVAITPIAVRNRKPLEFQG
jgi:MFS family permease